VRGLVEWLGDHLPGEKAVDVGDEDGPWRRGAVWELRFQGWRMEWFPWRASELHPDAVERLDRGDDPFTDSRWLPPSRGPIRWLWRAASELSR
jgi:hypothetical protein